MDFHAIFSEHVVLLNHKFGKCKKSASGWQNVQTVVVENLLILELSVSLSKMFEGYLSLQTRPSLKNSINA